MIGALLATGVMFVFLRSLPATLVGVVGIPICTIAAFLGLLMAGRTINVISLAGVAFAIGMTLDNSIVVLESIVRERSKGLGRMEVLEFFPPATSKWWWSHHRRKRTRRK